MQFFFQLRLYHISYIEERSMIEVRAIHDEQLGAYTIAFKYGRWEWDRVKGVISIIKVLIPASDREYNPVTKEWTVLEASWEALKGILASASFKIIEEKAVRPEDFHYDYSTVTPLISKESLAAKLLDLLELSTEDLKDLVLLKKAYRRKAMEWHPDRNNGDGTRMSELNSIWSQYNDRG
jgi:hypothetical protein